MSNKNKKMVLITELKNETMKASSISKPNITVGVAPIALHIAISLRRSLRLEKMIAVIPIKVVKITTIEIPINTFSTTPTTLHSS